MVDFDVVHPNIDESPNPDETPDALVRRLSISKAQAIKCNQSNSLIIGSDQITVHNGQLIGKPTDRSDAVKQLEASSGKIIKLYTGVALLNTATNSLQTDVISYQVRFRSLTPQMIEGYLAKESPYGCCGSLKAEGLGIALLEEMQGPDPTALIGLPLTVVTRMLQNEGVRVI